LTVTTSLGSRKPEAEFLEEKKGLGQLLKGKSIPVVHIRQSNKGNAVIEFPSVGDKEKAKAALKESAKHFSDQDDRQVPLFLQGLSVGDKDAGAATEERLKEQNPSLANVTFVWLERKSKRGGYHYVPKLLTPRTSALTLLREGRVTCDVTYDSYRVRLWKVSPLTCAKCLQKGHVAAKCEAPKATCRNCGLAHDPGTCDKQTSCNWCKGESKADVNHPAHPQECPTWKEWARVANSEMEKFVGWNNNV
jgi:hypothetical protein